MSIARRQFIAGIGGAVLWPSVLRAQQTARMRRVAVLTNTAETDEDEQLRLGAFRQQLRQLGWIDKTNLHVEYRWTVANTDQLRIFAAEIIAMKPDAIFVVGTTTVSTIMEGTSSIPIVFVTGADPVQLGFVRSMARPGRNATGFADFEDIIGTKWLQLLKETIPSVARVLYLHSNSQASLMQLPAIQASAAAIGAQVIPINVNSGAEIDRALDAYAGQEHMGLIVPPSSVAAVNRKAIIGRAARHGFPAIYANRRYPVEGGLMSYGIDRVEDYRQAAVYVDRILKGEQAADLPVQAPTKFEFVLNLKAAATIGLKPPRSILVRADEVIE